MADFFQLPNETIDLILDCIDPFAILLLRLISSKLVRTTIYWNGRYLSRVARFDELVLRKVIRGDTRKILAARPFYVRYLHFHIESSHAAWFARSIKLFIDVKSCTWRSSAMPAQDKFEALLL